LILLSFVRRRLRSAEADPVSSVAHVHSGTSIGQDG
jgi:hypothetical protein